MTRNERDQDAACNRMICDPGTAKKEGRRGRVLFIRTLVLYFGLIVYGVFSERVNGWVVLILFVLLLLNPWLFRK